MTNAAAIKLGNEISSNSLSLSDRMSTLSSGKRIQSASDDSANLQISNRLNKMGMGYQVAIRNANDGISVMQTAESGMQESTKILGRMRDLSIQAANATNQSSDLKSLNDEFTQLKQELNRIAEQTTFGGQNILNGSFGVQAFQVGAEANEIINGTLTSVYPEDMQLFEFTAAGQALGGIYTGASLGAADSALSLNGFGNGAPGASSEIITINGLKSDTVQLNSSDSAKEMSNKINTAFSDTGVKSEAVNNVSLHIHSGIASGRVAFEQGEQVEFNIGNGQNIATISFTATGDYGNDLASLMNKVNEQAAVTGIGAKINSNDSSLTLTSASGDNISISNFKESSEGVNNVIELGSLDKNGNINNTTSINNDGSSAIVRGYVSFFAPTGDSFSISSNADFGIIHNGLGTSGNNEFASTVSVSEVNILTQANAQSAISVIDASLATIDRARATVGAITNRLESTINNLANVYENTEGSRSQLVDADYSKEAAELAKLQVTQQASTAILSQANSIPQQAISLLG